MQTWKQIEDFPNYEVSDHGYVRRILSNGSYRVLTNGQSGCYRYYMVTFSLGQQIYKRYLHRVVAQEFLPNPNPALYDTVGFKNKDGHDCHIDNLYWTNQTELMETRKMQGKYAVGTDHHASKMTEATVVEARKLYQSKQKTISQLARMYGMDPSSMDSILKRTTWKHIE